MDAIYQVFFSDSFKMDELHSVIGEIARVDAPVLIGRAEGIKKSSFPMDRI